MLGYKDWREQSSWKLEARLGEGSFATVHEASHAATGAEAAVKASAIAQRCWACPAGRVPREAGR